VSAPKTLPLPDIPFDLRNLATFLPAPAGIPVVS